MLVGGIGLGTLLIICLVSLSIILCAVSLRTRSSVGPIFSTISILVIAVLIVIPRDSKTTSASSSESEYTLFIWRLLLLALLALSSAAGFAFLVVDTLASERHPRLVKL